MERRDFLQKLGLALGASALPISAIASTLSDEIVSDEVLNTKMKVYYFKKEKCYKSSFPGVWGDNEDRISRYHLTKEDAYVGYLLHQGGGPGADVLTKIQSVAWYTKYCLPYFGGHNESHYKEWSSSDIVSKEVTIDEFLKHNSNRTDIHNIEQSPTWNAMYMQKQHEKRMNNKNKRSSLLR